VSTISSIGQRVQQRLEEPVGPPGIFWNYTDEILPAVAEAMNEAALLTGVVQVVNTAYTTLPINTTYMPLPQNAIALLRVLGPYSVAKTTVFALDQMLPGWENEGGSAANPPVQQIQKWFPLGMTQWGIYPRLSVPQQVILTYLAYPVTVPRPYTGNENVPFQQEFQDAFEDYAAHISRLKEASAEFQTSQSLYQSFLDTMRQLNVFQSRHDSLVFTKTLGTTVRVIPVEVR
jgi:hypothetical protein